MRRKACTISILLFVLTTSLPSVWATEMYFTPDTVNANLGDTVMFSANITFSDTVRSFTVYLTYDTNEVDLVVAPTPGALLVGRPGLDFRYSDHIVAAPEWLEVGATIFGTSYWAGPGEIFQFGLVVRDCGVLPITASFSLRAPSGTFMPGTFAPPALFMCEAPPITPDSLTIFWTGSESQLRWKAVTENIFGQTLTQPPMYYIFRTDELSELFPFAVIDSTLSIQYLDTTATGSAGFYYVQAFGE
ncbi:MAG: hypothetical protein IPP40_04615 [bacterium]|nr:hypothetical protein [bacterium]